MTPLLSTRASTLSLLVSVACAASEKRLLDDKFGPAGARDRVVATASATPEFRLDIKPILDARCVVCHGCYDAPCQLKLSSYAGLDRGANKEKVYDGTRLLAASLSRLFLDAHSTPDWRTRSFSPVLNERAQTPDANLDASVLARMLRLKQSGPLPPGAILPDTFDLSLDRAQQCPTIEEFPVFATAHPLWGMPYALPALSPADLETLESWLRLGSPVLAPPPLDAATGAAVAEVESFLNQDSLKARLAARYIYEHLFVGSLFFGALPGGDRFRLVRSSTPPGTPVVVIATRRPYDDPGVSRVYYRLERDDSTVLSKTNLPYALDGDRLKRWRGWFLDLDYTVSVLPGYSPEVASNPFKAFELLPAASRYRFMLDDAQFIIGGFIKGPVCRGQIALNVIDDHFWVVFANPDTGNAVDDTAFLAREVPNLRLPAEDESNAVPLVAWRRSAKLEKAWLLAKGDYARRHHPEGLHPSLAAIWDGDGNNPNAALTIFRHFDSASVVRGFVGAAPKTAWVIGYPLLERIHYLLVAGFDVYGNVGHQVNTRLYMDFLRMEGESNFLLLLPEPARSAERTFWYRGAGADVAEYMDGRWLPVPVEPAITFLTETPKLELFAMLQQCLAPVLDHALELRPTDVPVPAISALAVLSGLKGAALVLLPELSLLSVKTDGGDRLFTLIHNDAHTNLAALFGEDSRRVPDEDTLTVARGVVGAYPGAFFRVDAADLPAFVDRVATLKVASDYTALMDRFGVRRTAPDFWKFSDTVQAHARLAEGLGGGLLDYNRLENR